MKLIRSAFYPFITLIAIFTLQACKAKKLAQKPAPVDTVKTMQQALTPAPLPPPQPPAPTPAPVAPAKPDYNFSNIQFEFNSGVLTTSSYPVLDKAVAQMKMDPSAKFMLSGYASAEGTPEHNMSLSADRANAVKIYLINSGVNAGNISTKGFGEANPVADNTTEAGRILNRRVEIKLN